MRSVPASLRACPARLPLTTSTIPAGAISGETDRLVPATPIRSAVLCSYVGSNMGPPAAVPRTAAVQLAGDLSLITADLRWMAPDSGTPHSCSLVGGRQTNFLLGLTLADGGFIWVAADQDPNDCMQTTNGSFKALYNSGEQFAAVLLARHWVSTPPAAGWGPCEDEGGRFGQQNALVPAGAIAVDACDERKTPGRLRRLSADQQARLTAALNALPAHPSEHACAQDLDPKTKEGLMPDFYRLIFRYPTGPSVGVGVARGCTPNVDNDSLQADSSTVLTLVQQLFR